jgi:hypothetical protein
MVGHRTLTPRMGVQLPFPQPNKYNLLGLGLVHCSLLGECFAAILPLFIFVPIKQAPFSSSRPVQSLAKELSHLLLFIRLSVFHPGHKTVSRSWKMYSLATYTSRIVSLFPPLFSVTILDTKEQIGLDWCSMRENKTCTQFDGVLRLLREGGLIGEKFTGTFTVHINEGKITSVDIHEVLKPN